MIRVNPSNSSNPSNRSQKGNVEKNQKMIAILVRSLSYSQKNPKGKKVLADYQSPSGETEYALFARPLSKGELTPNPKQSRSFFKKKRIRTE